MSLTISSILLLIFFLVNKKESWKKNFSTSFECGFASYLISRNSFSVQYFFIGLLFLLLELEFCLMIPFMIQSICEIKLFIYLSMFLFVILILLVMEWINNSIEWKK